MSRQTFQNQNKRSVEQPTHDKGLNIYADSVYTHRRFQGSWNGLLNPQLSAAKQDHMP